MRALVLPIAASPHCSSCARSGRLCCGPLQRGCAWLTLLSDFSLLIRGDRRTIGRECGHEACTMPNENWTLRRGHAPVAALQRRSAMAAGSNDHHSAPLFQLEMPEQRRDRRRDIDEAQSCRSGSGSRRGAAVPPSLLTLHSRLACRAYSSVTHPARVKSSRRTPSPPRPRSFALDRIFLLTLCRCVCRSLFQRTPTLSKAH